MEFIYRENIFQKFHDKPMERESGLGVGTFFSENSIAGLRVNWCVPYIQRQNNKIFST